MAKVAKKAKAPKVAPHMTGADLPSTVFVQWYSDDLDGRFLSASATVDDALCSREDKGENWMIGKYQLVRRGVIVQDKPSFVAE